MISQCPFCYFSNFKFSNFQELWLAPQWFSHFPTLFLQFILLCSWSDLGRAFCRFSIPQNKSHLCRGYTKLRFHFSFLFPILPCIATESDQFLGRSRQNLKIFLFSINRSIFNYSFFIVRILILNRFSIIQKISLHYLIASCPDLHALFDSADLDTFPLKSVLMFCIGSLLYWTLRSIFCIFLRMKTSSTRILADRSWDSFHLAIWL